MISRFSLSRGLLCGSMLMAIAGCGAFNQWLTAPAPTPVQCATSAVLTPAQASAVQVKITNLNTFLTDQVALLPMITAGQRNVILQALAKVQSDSGQLGSIDNPVTPAGLQIDLNLLDAAIAQQQPILASLIQPYEKPIVDLLVLYTGCPATP